MNVQNRLHDIDHRIQLLKHAALELSRDADEIPAVSKNTARILASIKMLELNISDLLNPNKGMGRATEKPNPSP